MSDTFEFTVEGFDAYLERSGDEYKAFVMTPALGKQEVSSYWLRQKRTALQIEMNLLNEAIGKLEG